MTLRSVLRAALTYAGRALFFLFWLDDTVRFFGVHRRLLSVFFRGEARIAAPESCVDVATFEKAYIALCYVVYTWNLSCSRTGLWIGLALIAFGLLEVSSAYRALPYADTVRALASGAYPQNYEALCVGMIVFIAGLYVCGRQTVKTTLLHGLLLLSYIARIFWATAQGTSQ